MLKKIEIVPLAKEHIPFIHQIEKLSFSAPWSKKILYDELEFELSVLFVAVISEKKTPIGFAGMHHVIDEGLINNIAVHPSFRSKGVGQLLLKKLIHYGCINDFYRLTLEVRVSNKSALALYERLGFKNEGVRPGYYDKPKEDAFIYSYFY